MTSPEPSEQPESIWAAVRSDFATATGVRVLVVVGLVAWLVFQWGFGNDAILPSIAALVLDHIDNGATWTNGIFAALCAGFAGFVFWAATQTIDAVVVLTGVRHMPAITSRMASYLQRKGWVKAYNELSWSTRWAIAYAAGASAVVLVDVFATGTPGVKQRRSMITTSVLLSAGTIGAVVTLVSMLAVIALRVPATEDAAEVIIRFAKNPLTWLFLIGLVVGIGKLRSRNSDQDM